MAALIYLTFILYFEPIQYILRNKLYFFVTNISSNLQKSHTSAKDLAPTKWLLHDLYLDF